jgi:hypothetical protein
VRRRGPTGEPWVPPCIKNGDRVTLGTTEITFHRETP